MADRLIIAFKQKEFDRLKNCVLNQISTIEIGLNVASISRGQYANQEIWVPTTTEIKKLYETLMQLRAYMLSPEEKELLK